MGNRHFFERGSSVHVLHGRPELPEKRVRDEMARVTHDDADRTIASALVVDGDGFWAWVPWSSCAGAPQ